MTFLRKIPFWGWVGMAIAALFLWQSLSGFAYSRKLFDVALDHLRTDQSRVVETLEDEMGKRESELADLYKRIDIIQRQAIAAKTESEGLRRLVHEKDSQIESFRRERETVSVPIYIDDVADAFRARGYFPRVVFPSR